ncbi:MAG: toll/interleukin-1 receptor domain-containing protein [Pirellulaceae bacterium]
MKIFLSHRSRDKATVRDFQRSLPSFLNSWLDEENLEWGDSIADRLKETIDLEADFVVIFLDKDTLDSEWVVRELGWALEREASLGRTFLLPVVLGNVTNEALPPSISSRLHLRLEDYTASSIEHLASRATEKLFQLVIGGHASRRQRTHGTKEDAPDLSKHLGQVRARCWMSPHLHQYHVITTLRAYGENSGLLIDDTTVTYQIRIAHMNVDQFLYKYRYVWEMTMPRGTGRALGDTLIHYEATFGSESYSLSDVTSSVICSGGRDVARFALSRDVTIKDRTNVTIRQQCVTPVNDRSISVIVRYPTRGLQLVLSYDEQNDFEFIWFKGQFPEAQNLPGHDEYHVLADGISVKTFGWLLPGEGVCVMWEPQ